MSVKVSFLCVGAQKCGTTTLRAYLREHPQLDVPENEVHFFDDESFNWETSIPLSDYHGHFRSLAVDTPAAHEVVLPISECLIAGEVTPIYMYWLPCLQRIYRYNPCMKIIIFLRNPIDRAHSHWSMEYLRGSENFSFSEAIRLEESRLDGASYRQHRVYSYIDRGYYYRQIVRFYDIFPAENICILSAENFYIEPDYTLGQISRFLKISNFEPSFRHHCRKGGYSKPLHIDDWKFIYDRLSGDISRLSSKVDWDVSSWTVPSGDTKRCV